MISAPSALRKVFLIPLLFFALFCKAQQPASPKNGKAMTPSGKAVQNMLPSVKHDTCLNKKFSVVCYVILDSTYSEGMANPQELDTMFMNINSHFKNICVTLEKCSTVLIPIHQYNDWIRPQLDTIVTSNWYTARTINMYFVDVIKQNFSYESAGYAYAPPQPPVGPNTTSKDVIVMQKSHIKYNKSMVPMHLLGHFFGLYHTHDEINPTAPANPPPPSGVLSKEYVDRSNCAIHGDGLCDTQADHTSSVMKDGKGQFYNKPIDNFMSFSNTSFRYTQQQYNRMAYVILTRRWYLH